MTDYKEILRLECLGMNHSQIAESVGCTRQTVISVLRKAKRKGIGYAEAKALPNSVLAHTIKEGGLERVAYKMPDYDWVHRELCVEGVTLNLLWIEYCEECRACGQLPYQSTQFNKYYGEYVKKTGATMHIVRKPGESLEVDWAGGSVKITDSVTGMEAPAFIFVSALSYSGYVYAEAFWSMEQDDWIKAHVSAYEFFGGVTRLLVPDNLKTGVERNTKTETLLNKTYQEMAEHYGTAVIPTRIYSPNDKPNVEGAVKTVKMWILASLRNNRYFTLQELNADIRAKLEEYNTKPFQKSEGSRYSRFMDEKEFLLPLPKYPFERAEWRQETVRKDYHVKCGAQYYSVPFEYIGRSVDIRATKDTVEILYDGVRIASHKKDDSFPDNYVTKPEHMPPAHQKYSEWSGDGFRSRAGKIGTSVSACVEYFLTSARVEQQAYKTCNALLSLAGKYTGERLEAACARVLSIMPRPTFKAVDSVLRSGKDKSSVSNERNDSVEATYGFIRGAEYYGGDDNAE